MREPRRSRRALELAQDAAIERDAMGDHVGMERRTRVPGLDRGGIAGRFVLGGQDARAARFAIVAHEITGLAAAVFVHQLEAWNAERGRRLQLAGGSARAHLIVGVAHLYGAVA